MHVLKGKWVIAFRLNPDESIKAVKARYVACGYSQRAGSEYTDVFAKTLASCCLRVFCAIIALDDLETDSLDEQAAAWKLSSLTASTWLITI